MVYSNIIRAKFISRPNRFIANCTVDGKAVIAHVKNTGRLGELLVTGATCYLEYAPSERRKTDYSLISIERDGALYNIDAQAPNQVVEEFLCAGNLLPHMDAPAEDIKREQTYRGARFDFSFTANGRKCFLEAKGVTLKNGNTGLFPDAPTLRGIKHLEHLAHAAKEGYGAYVLFVIKAPGITRFSPNDAKQPAFGHALRHASRHGVNVCAYDCWVKVDLLELHKPVKIVLS